MNNLMSGYYYTQSIRVDGIEKIALSSRKIYSGLESNNLFDFFMLIFMRRVRRHIKESDRLCLDPSFSTLDELRKKEGEGNINTLCSEKEKLSMPYLNLQDVYSSRLSRVLIEAKSFQYLNGTVGNYYHQDNFCINTEN